MSVNIRKLFIFLFIAMAICSVLHGQTVLSNQPEQDCFGAIPICNTTYSTTSSYSGSGIIPNEININYSCLSSGEKNDVWYLFRTHSAGYISFTITPVNPQDDYDWAVFNITHTSCSNIYNDPSMEVSCNYDANIGCNGVTGPNGNQGPCGQTESVISVQANEIYLINISNYSSSQSGYTIDFGESTATIFDTLPPRALNDTLSCTQTSVKIIFNEPVACSSLTFSGSDFAIADNSGNKIFPQSITYVGCDSLHPYITEAEIFLNVPLSNSAVYYLLAANGSDQNTIADLCGNFVSAEDTLATFVMVNNLSVDLGSDVYTCPSAELPLLYSPSTSATGYNWYHNGVLADTTVYYHPNDTGQYILYAYSGSMCFAFDTLVIHTLPSLQVSLSGNHLVCEGQPLPTLTAAVSDSSASISWFENGLPVASDTSQYQPAQTGFISVTAEASGYCTSTATAMVTTATATAPEITGQSLCRGSSAVLNVTNTGEGNLIWIFQNDTLEVNKNSITVTAEGNYIVVYTDSNGCTNSDSLSVHTVDVPSEPQIFCPELSTNGNTFTWQPVFAESLLLSTDGGFNILTLAGNITSYTTSASVRSIQLTSANGQCHSQTVESPQCEVYITHLLSPNSADRYFTISGLETPVSLNVYDAQGNQVYSKADYQNNWYAPQMRQGMYFYSIKAGKAHYLSGKLLILK